MWCPRDVEPAAGSERESEKRRERVCDIQSIGRLIEGLIACRKDGGKRVRETNLTCKSIQTSVGAPVAAVSVVRCVLECIHMCEGTGVGITGATE